MKNGDFYGIYHDLPMKNGDFYGIYPLKMVIFLGFLGFWDVRMILRWLTVKHDGFVEILRSFF